jgi:MFS family permease
VLPVLVVGFLDEFQSGGPVLGAPALERELGLDHAATGFWLFTVPLLVCLLADPVLLLATERFRRRTMLVAGLLGMAMGQVLVAVTAQAWTLALAIALWAIAIGFADSQAEMALVQDDPEHVDRSMTRWAIAASLGDFLGPLMVAAALATGGSWRTIALFSAVLALVDALFVLRGPDFEAVDDDEEEELAPLREAIPAALRAGDLSLWLLAGATCVFLDEIFVVLGGLYIIASGGTLASSALVFAAYAIGGAPCSRSPRSPPSCCSLCGSRTPSAPWRSAPSSCSAPAWRRTIRSVARASTRRRAIVRPLRTRCRARSTRSISSCRSRSVSWPIVTA